MIINYLVFLLRMLIYAFATLLVIYFFKAGMPLWFFLWPPALIYGVHVLAQGRELRHQNLYNAHWASPLELNELVVQYPCKDGILMGYAYGKTLGIRPGSSGQKELGHVLICGPSRSGKGLHLMSNLLSWASSTVVVDIKGEMYRLTSGHRSSLGQRIIKLSPSGDGHRYDPFSELQTDESILGVSTLIMDPEADGSNSAFARRAAFFVAAMIKAALTLEQPVLPFIARVTEQGITQSCLELWKLNNDKVRRNIVNFLNHPADKMDWDQVSNDKFLNNSWANMITKLQPFFSDGILKMTSASDFSTLSLVTQPTSVYLCFQESELEYTGAAFRIILMVMINSLIRHFDLNPDAETLPLLFGFDEAGRLNIPKLPELVSTVAGRGMSALIYVQSLSQLEEAYGDAGKSTILDNTHTKLFYRPKDSQTAEYISEKCGQLMAEDMRQSDGMEGSVNQSVGVRPRELITSDEIQRWPLERCVVITEKPPIVAHRLQHWLLPGAKVALERKAIQPPAMPVEVTRAKLPSEVLPSDPSSAAVPAKSPAKPKKPYKPVELEGDFE